MSFKVPARIHFFIARKKNIAVVLRRGPSAYVQMLKWNLNSDTFEAGQWFKGRIYEQRCSLSPNGQHFVYFASKFSDHQMKTKVGECWTAISKPPYFTALEIYPQDDTYGGGGFFAADNQLSVNRPKLVFPGEKIIPTDPITSKYLSDTKPLNGISGYNFQKRLNSEGWKIIQKWEFIYHQKGYYHETIRPEIREKHIGRGKTILFERARNSNGITECFRLLDNKTEYALEDVYWVDADHRGRLLIGFEGKILALPKTKSFQGIEKMDCLVDLNQNVFKNVKANYEGLKI